MQPSLYVSLSGQMALMRRLETIAHNVANAHTAGYRAEGITFEDVLSDRTQDAVHFASTGEHFISRRVGEITPTGNPLDLAIKGDAWFGIQTQVGTVYTRDGRMQMTPEGQLQSLNGHPILDVGGAPLQLNPNNGPPKIAGDGTITQGNNRVGAVGLFIIPDDVKLKRFDNSGMIPEREPEPALDFNKTSIAQGFVERANVNPVLEISKLIMIQRSFDAITGSIDKTEGTLDAAIRTLGDTA